VDGVGSTGLTGDLWNGDGTGASASEGTFQARGGRRAGGLWWWALASEGTYHVARPLHMQRADADAAPVYAYAPHYLAFRSRAETYRGGRPGPGRGTYVFATSQVSKVFSSTYKRDVTHTWRRTAGLAPGVGSARFQPFGLGVGTCCGGAVHLLLPRAMVFKIDAAVRTPPRASVLSQHPAGAIACVGIARWQD